MKKAWIFLKTLYRTGDVAFYCSLIPPFAMGVLHLAALFAQFDWIVCNYCIFSFLMGLFRVWLWAIEKFGIRPRGYAAGIFSILLVLLPMMASFVLTILFKEPPQYPLDWLIYAYALYGTVKIVLAIRAALKGRKNQTERAFVLSRLGLIGAFYTIQMMQFRLIMFASDGTVDNTMYQMQFYTQGAIFLYSLFVIGELARMLIRARGKKPDGETR